MNRLSVEFASKGMVRVHQCWASSFSQDVQEGTPAARFRMRVTDGPRADNEVWINMGAGGLGDTLLGLCAVNGYKQANPDKLVVYRFSEANLQYVLMFDGGYDGISWHQFDGTVNDFPPVADARDMQLNAGYQLELSGKAQVSRLERYCRNVGHVQPVMPVLRDRAKIVRAAKDCKDTVVLAPFASTADRTYPLHSWVTIERELRDLGFDTIVTGIHRGPKVLGTLPGMYKGKLENAEYVHATTDCFSGRVVMEPSAEHLAGMLLTAKCVIGNDSGPAHLAAIMGTPTIVLCGWSVGERIYGAYPAAACLDGSLACGGCWTQTKDYDEARCNRACANLWSIDPHDVVREVLARVPAPAPDESNGQL